MFCFVTRKVAFGVMKPYFKSSTKIEFDMKSIEFAATKLELSTRRIQSNEEGWHIKLQINSKIIGFIVISVQVAKKDVNSMQSGFNLIRERLNTSRRKAALTVQQTVEG